MAKKGLELSRITKIWLNSYLLGIIEIEDSLRITFGTLKLLKLYFVSKASLILLASRSISLLSVGKPSLSWIEIVNAGVPLSALTSPEKFPNLLSKLAVKSIPCNPSSTTKLLDVLN